MRVLWIWVWAWNLTRVTLIPNQISPGMGSWKEWVQLVLGHDWKFSHIIWHIEHKKKMVLFVCHWFGDTIFPMIFNLATSCYRSSVFEWQIHLLLVFDWLMLSCRADCNMYWLQHLFFIIERLIFFCPFYWFLWNIYLDWTYYARPRWNGS